MRPVIKYISFYDFADSGIARNYSVAAANKMDYIIESLVRIGYDVEVVSVSACIESGTFRWYKSRVEERQPHVKTRFFSSFRCRSKILVLLRLIWGVLQLLSYLLFVLKRRVYMGIPFFVLLQCDFAGKKNKEIQTDSRSRRDLSRCFSCSSVYGTLGMQDDRRCG